MKNKFAFVVPYIGKFHPWFQLWLNSCARNKFVDWLIFTDDCTQYNYPSNVHVHYVTFEELISFFQKNFDFKIALTFPYKFCDFRPAYGEIFSEFLSDYLFWGYCDTDLVWGNLGKWLLSDQILSYDRISHWGHCTLLRNVPKINSLYKNKIEGISYYKDVFTDQRHYAFDEECGFNILTRNFGVKEYVIPFFDVKPLVQSYKLEPTFVAEAFFQKAIESKIVKVSDRGVELYAIKDGKTMVQKEFAYVHLQKRKMDLEISLSDDNYLIVPNKFVPCQDLTVSIIRKMAPSDLTSFVGRQQLLFGSRLHEFYSILKKSF